MKSEFLDPLFQESPVDIHLLLYYYNCVVLVVPLLIEQRDFFHLSNFLGDITTQSSMIETRWFPSLPYPF